MAGLCVLWRVLGNARCSQSYGCVPPCGLSAGCGQQKKEITKGLLHKTEDFAGTWMGKNAFLEVTYNQFDSTYHQVDWNGSTLNNRSCCLEGVAWPC